MSRGGRGRRKNKSGRDSRPWDADSDISFADLKVMVERLHRSDPDWSVFTPEEMKTMFHFNEKLQHIEVVCPRYQSFLNMHQCVIEPDKKFINEGDDGFIHRRVIWAKAAIVFKPNPVNIEEDEAMFEDDEQYGYRSVTLMDKDSGLKEIKDMLDPVSAKRFDYHKGKHPFYRPREPDPDSDREGRESYRDWRARNSKPIQKDSGQLVKKKMGPKDSGKSSVLQSRNTNNEGGLGELSRCISRVERVLSRMQ
jgi:hypothetical protein